MRGINVSGRHKVPMARLRTTCERVGCHDVRTYIQSGNVVCAAGVSAGTLEATLERAIEKDFGFAVPVIVRSGSRWDSYVEGNPFLDEARQEPGRVLLAASKRPPQSDAVSALRAYASPGERVEQNDDVVWIYYEGGIGRSKLSPAVLDRCVGSPVTARNWRTVLRLADMVQAFTAEDDRAH